MPRNKERLRPNLWDLPVVLAVLALAFFTLPKAAAAAETVTVCGGGAVMDRFAPAALLAAPRQYTHRGYTLTLAAEQTPQGVALRVTESDCPGQDCLHTGAILYSGESIVCLPAEMVITLGGGETAVDAVTG